MLADERYRDIFDERERPFDERLVRAAAASIIRAWARCDLLALVAAAQAFAVSRFVLLVVTYVALAFHPTVWGHSHPPSTTPWDAWYQWDARWYVRVARSGYHWHDLQHWSSVAFFPLYPLMILALVTVLPVSTKLVAMIISNALFFVALYVLHRLVHREFSARLARRVTIYISLFPTAFFFFAGYSESAFLLFSVLSIAAMRQRHWVQAGVWGCLAAVTRSQGLALMVPFAVECWQAYGKEWRQWARALWIGVIPLGWLALGAYMQVRFGNALLFLQIQRAWHRETTWPWVGIWHTLQRIPLNHIASVDPAHNVIELVSICGFAVLIALGRRRLPASFTLYTAASLLLILLNPAVLDNYYLPLMSSSRLCLALFPCFITLALYGEHELVDRVVTTMGPALMAVFAVVFLQGAWIA